MEDKAGQGGPVSKKKVRVAFRRNRGRPARVKDWTRQTRQAEDGELDAHQSEQIRTRGELSRKRTILVDESDRFALKTGVVLSIRGRLNEVDADGQVWLCGLRRLLRTQLIDARSPLTVGDVVRFREASSPTRDAPGEGFIERVEPRRTELLRKAGKRVHAVAANVDQVIIVTSAGLPPPKPHLVDRYIVAALKGRMTPLVCLNKIDLDPEAEEILDPYRALGYAAFAASALTGAGLEALRAALTGRSSVLVGQSGVGKSALLNALQPDLNLRVGALDRRFGKGRHTTTTAILMPLRGGGYIVDTPGVRSMDISVVGRHELEQYFVEFLEFIPSCRFPDCTHIHEADCAVIRGVEGGAIDPLRHESYVRMFTDPAYEPCYD